MCIYGCVRGSRGTGQVCAWAVIGRRPVRGRCPAASGFWETHTARVLIKNTQETLSTDAGPSLQAHTLTLSHVYIHVPSTGSNWHYFLLGAKCRKCIDTYFNSIFCFSVFWLGVCGSRTWLWKLQNSLCQNQTTFQSFINILANIFLNKIIFPLDPLKVPWIWLFPFPQIEYSNFVNLHHGMHHFCHFKWICILFFNASTPTKLVQIIFRPRQVEVTKCCFYVLHYSRVIPANLTPNRKWWFISEMSLYTLYTLLSMEYHINSPGIPYKFNYSATYRSNTRSNMLLTPTHKLIVQWECHWGEWLHNYIFI